MTDKPKRGCNVKVESGQVDLNKGDDKKFDSARYAANPKKGFNDALSKALDKWSGKQEV